MKQHRLFLVALLLVAGPAVPSFARAQAEPEVDDVTREAAREHYRRGRRLFQDGQPEEALRELQVSYTLMPHWATLNGMALCQEDLGQHREAMETYGRALAEGGADVPAAQRTEILDRLRALRVQLGLAHLQVVSEPPGAAVFLDDALMGTTPFDEDVPAGSYALMVVLEDVGRAERDLTLAAGEDRTLEMTLVQLAAVPDAPVGVLAVASDPPGATVFLDDRRIGVTPVRAPDVPTGDHVVRVEDERARTWEDRITVSDGSEVRIDVALAGSGIHQGWFWGTLGAAALCGIGGAVAGGIGVDLYDEYHDPATSVSRRIDARDTGEVLFDAADGLFIGAGAVAIAAAVLAAFTDWGGGAPAGEVQIVPLTGGATGVGGTAWMPAGGAW